MVELLDSTYRALSHPIRREVLSRLRAGPHRVTDLAEGFTISLAAVSKHIHLLEQAQLLARDARGREHFMSLEPQPLAEAGAWLARNFWEGRLDALEAHLRGSG